MHPLLVGVRVMTKMLTKSIGLATCLSLTASPLLFGAAQAQAQPYYRDNPGYGGAPAEGYDGDQAPPPPPGSYARAPYDDRADGYAQRYPDAYRDAPPPPGYDASRPPPPPPGYQPGEEQLAQDRDYARRAEDWAAAYCTRSRGNAGVGAVVGGLFGALVGSGLSGRHDHGTGALVGGLVGAGGGAAIASSANNATSPGCPPGYVVRGGAPAFYYDEGAYAYAAPTWYRPWAFDDGRWLYRPYPYHAWYYRNYYAPRYHGGPRYYGYRGRRY